MKAESSMFSGSFRTYGSAVIAKRSEQATVPAMACPARVLRTGQQVFATARGADHHQHRLPLPDLRLLALLRRPYP
jgi:hypothetical protein